MSQRVRRQYSDSDVVAALIAVKNGLSLRKAAAQFGIPQATLCDKKKQKHCIGRGRPGPASKLGHVQEKRLVVYLQHMALIGHEIARKDVAAIVKSILDAGDGQGGAARNSRFANCNMPSVGWVCRFFNRFRELDACMPVNHGRLRTPASESTIREWFERLTFFFRVQYDINVTDFLSNSNAAQIFSVRENTFPLAVSNEWRCNQMQEKRNVDHSSIDDDKQVTVLCCGGADGRLPKPFVVFPSKECSSDHSCSNPLDLDVVFTPGGLISPDFFCQWLTTSFFPSVKDKVSSPILLFVDCPSLLISITVYDFCTLNGIILFCLPYHSSCVMQPLEMSVFRPLQVIWNDTLLAFDEEHCGAAMSKAEFIPFFRIAWQKAQIKSQNIKSGFQMTGLVPFNPDTVSYSDLLRERVPVPQKKFLVTLEEISSKTEKLGMVRIFQMFEDCMTDDLRVLFENRFTEGYDRVDDQSDRSILWQFYRQCRLLVGDGPRKFRDNQVTYTQVNGELKNNKDFTIKEEQGHFQSAEIDEKQEQREQIALDALDEMIEGSTSPLFDDSSLSSTLEATTGGKKRPTRQGLTIISESVTQIDAIASSSSLGVNHSHSNMLAHADNTYSRINTQSTDPIKHSPPVEQSISINSTITASEHANKTRNLDKIIGRHHTRVQKKWKQKEFFAYMCKQAYKAQQLKKEFVRLKSQEQCKVTEYLDLVAKKQDGASEDINTSSDRRKEEELAREINLLKNITKHMVESDESSTGTSGTEDE